MHFLKTLLPFALTVAIGLLLFSATPAGAMVGPSGQPASWSMMPHSILPSSPSHITTRPTTTAPPSGCPGWKLVNSPNPGVGANELLGVAAASDDNIWSVGYYTVHPGGNALPLAMRLNGHQWHAITLPIPHGARSSVMLGVARIPRSNQFWSIGYWMRADGNFFTLIERWDGKNWSIIPSPNGMMDSSLTAVTALSTTDAWAVGGYLDAQSIFHPLVERWNGARWHIVPSPTPPEQLGGLLNGVTASTDGTAWAAGDSYNAGLYGQVLIERWDGMKWSIVVDANPPGAASSDLTGISGSSPPNIWAVGDYQDINSHVFTLSERWNGSAWQVISSPNQPGDIANVLQGIAAPTAKTAWAVGFGTDPNGNQATLIEHWDGTSWHIVPSPNSSQPNNILQSVAAIPHSSHVVSVGIAIDNNLNSVTLTEMC